MIATNMKQISEAKEKEILIKTQLYHMNKEELIKKILLLQEQKNTQEEFLLNISHDLRSPLNVILSAIQCYNDLKKDKHICIIKRNCYKILKLINNLIDTAKLDNKYYNLSLENNDIISLIEGNIELIDKYAKQKSISLVFDTNVEECIMAIDSDAIDRIITNLISNAIKFSPQGSHIYINVWKTKKEVNISVKDQGVGIPIKEQKNIFDRFVQSMKNRDSDQKGSGIGLELVKCLTEAHKGSIKLISEENKGCEFIVTLPVIKLNNEKEKDREVKAEKKVEILEMEFSDIYL